MTSRSTPWRRSSSTAAAGRRWPHPSPAISCSMRSAAGCRRSRPIPPTSARRSRSSARRCPPRRPTRRRRRCGTGHDLLRRPGTLRRPPRPGKAAGAQLAAAAAAHGGRLRRVPHALLGGGRIGSPLGGAADDPLRRRAHGHGGDRHDRHPLLAGDGAGGLRGVAAAARRGGRHGLRRHGRAALDPAGADPGAAFGDDEDRPRDGAGGLLQLAAAGEGVADSSG